MLDLHIHTTCSDGQYTPQEIVSLSKQKGLEAIAITDHDVIDGLKEGAACAKEQGVTFINGIEISLQGNKELHLLGYGIDPDNRKLKETCDWFKRQRDARDSKIFAYLAERGILLDEEQVKRIANKDKTFGRPHYAQAMVEQGYVKSVQEAFDKHLAVPEFSRIERPKLKAEEGMELILQAGGFPVLAHPKLLRLADDELEELVQKLTTLGLKGIECFYSLHSQEETQLYLKLAEKNGLYVTIGSDFHGERVKPSISLGTGVECNLLCYEHHPALKRYVDYWFKP